MRMRFTLAAIAVLATFALPARADVTLKSQDGTMELTLPNGWHEAKHAGGASVKIHATDGRGARVTVRVHSKEDFKDIKAFANFTAERLKKKFVDAEPKFEDIQVSGKPAVRVSMTGTAASGKRAGYIISIFEADGMYVSVTGAANASAFARDEQVLAGVANDLKMTSAAPSQPPQAPSSTPAPAPSGKPAARTPPPR
jgi:hypothetical protein